jgi:DNA-binding transcriptional LysR family regulator
MNTEQMRTLVNVVDCGSLSAAARIQRISQPAVTKQIQRLEAELGLQLLIRGPRRRVALTPAGEQVLAFAREMLLRLEALEQGLGTLREVSSGILVLAASTIPGEYVLPGLLAAFKTRYPRIEVRTSVSDTADVVTRLQADEADIGIIGSFVQEPGLRLEPLVGDEIVLAVPPDHAFAGRKRVHVEELRGQPLILREEGSGTRRSVEAVLAEKGMSLPKENVALILGSTQAVLQGVARGLGVGFVSARASAQDQASGRVGCVRLAGVDLRRYLYLAYQPTRIGDPLVMRFLEFALHSSLNRDNPEPAR